jgi:DNA repair photolyase
MENFDRERTGTGTKEWAEVTENICRGCANNCLYCYAAHSANRFKLKDRGEWAKEELTKRASIASYPARDGVVMFPSSHDITLYNLAAYIRVARLILAAGNHLLIVSKPRRECIWSLLSELREYKEQILFRFTTGTVNDETSCFWEPGAPLPLERISCLAMANGEGFATSVSMEPLLGGVITARSVIKAVKPFVSDSIWIGKMNKIRTRVIAGNDIDREWIAYIEQRQTDAEMIRLYDEFKNDPLIRWKDSIKEVVARCRGEVEKVDRHFQPDKGGCE